MTRLPASVLPKAEKRTRPRKYRPGVYAGRVHLWRPAWDGWEQKCNGLGVNVATPQWEGHDGHERCTGCYEGEGG